MLFSANNTKICRQINLTYNFYLTLTVCVYNFPGLRKLNLIGKFDTVFLQSYKMNALLRRAAIEYLKTNARSSTHAATAGGHGGKDSIFENFKNYVTR